ncbi:hypothetical protein KO116_P100051 (plasmid) [Halomonas sp. KO116]|jgi:hypothetical protein|nr:hypothetical protein KO116_P100051 [Halomonas sp. KO116]
MAAKRTARRSFFCAPTDSSMAGSVTLQAVFETLNWPQAGLDVHRNGERTMMHLTHYMCTRYARYSFLRRAIPMGNHPLGILVRGMDDSY